MSMSNLLKRYIRLVLEGEQLARVPQQLVSPDSDKSEKADEEEVENVKEFSGAGGAAGYTLPLGMDQDSAGRQKNSLRRDRR